MARSEIDNSLFQLLVLSFSNAALVGLGLLPSPESGKVESDRVAASHNIDILCMLEAAKSSLRLENEVC